MFGGRITKVLKDFFGVRPAANLELAEKYQQVFDTEAGREVLTDLIKFSKILDVDSAHQDIYNAGYAEGMKRLGLRVISFLNIEVEKSKNIKVNQDQDYN